MNKYTTVEEVGRGAYGTVYKCQDISDGQIYALKTIEVKPEDEGIPSTTIREVSLLKLLDHINIVTLYDVIHKDMHTMSLVFEFLECDLTKLIKETVQKNGNNDVKSGFPKEVYKGYLYQILQGVNYIHKNKILHRDLKPQNILINKQGILKIADFGLARAFSIPVKNYTNEVITQWYRPPDLLLGSMNYFTTADIWSVGCIFAEMVTGTVLFPAKTEEKLQLKKIFKIRGTPNSIDHPNITELPNWNNNIEKYPEQPLSKFVPQLDKDGLDLLDAMLQLDPEKRISAEDALKHPFFNDIPDSLRELYKSK
jgi:cyclin-dependent kinase